jgi:hypothetical protein
MPPQRILAIHQFFDVVYCNHGAKVHRKVSSFQVPSSKNKSSQLPLLRNNTIMLFGIWKLELDLLTTTYQCKSTTSPPKSTAFEKKYISCVESPSALRFIHNRSRLLTFNKHTL